MEKQRWEESERRRAEERRSEKRKSQTKEDAGARKGGKVAIHGVFQWFVAAEGRKVGSLKRRVRSNLAREEMKSEHFWKLRCKTSACHFVARSTFPSQNAQNTSVSERFWKLRYRKVDAVVAGSTFRSQNIQSTPGSDHFLKLRCRKNARDCGAKRVSKSNAQNTSVSERFWKLRYRKVDAVVAGSTFRSQKIRSTAGSDHFSKLRCRKSARRCDAKRVSKSSQNVKSTACSDNFWAFRCRFAWQVQGIVDLVKNQQNVGGLVTVSKALASLGHLKRIWKDACRVAGAVQETCSSEMLGGQGADFMREVAFWSLRSSRLLRWLCVTDAALRTTWHQFFVEGNARGSFPGYLLHFGAKICVLHAFWS